MELKMEGHDRRRGKLLRIADAAEYLDGVVTPATLRQWVWRGQIDVVRIGRVVCIPQEALDRLIERGSAPARET
jgi:excisionase family DNA binding protein